MNAKPAGDYCLSLVCILSDILWDQHLALQIVPSMESAAMGLP